MVANHGREATTGVIRDARPWLALREAGYHHSIGDSGHFATRVRARVRAETEVILSSNEFRAEIERFSY
jgi:hypothetical protein